MTPSACWNEKCKLRPLQGALHIKTARWVNYNVGPVPKQWDLDPTPPQVARLSNTLNSNQERAKIRAPAQRQCLLCTPTPWTQSLQEGGGSPRPTARLIYVMWQCLRISNHVRHAEHCQVRPKVCQHGPLLTTQNIPALHFTTITAHHTIADRSLQYICIYTHRERGV